MAEANLTHPAARDASDTNPWLGRSLALAACICITCLVVLSWSPRDSIARTGAPGPFEHVVAYWGTGLVAAFAAPRLQQRWLAGGLVALAGVLELGQLWIPGRTSQVIDFAGSSLGAILGIACAAMAPSMGTDRTETGAQVRRGIGVGLIFLGVALTPIWIAFLLWFGLSLLARMLG
jgi:hypothetical protein